MCTQLIPARKGLQISKERGKCSMLGKGGRERNYLVPHRQHKAYRVKAILPELQFRRSFSRQWRKDSRKAILTGYLQFHKVGAIPPGQRTTNRGGGRKRTEHLRMPVLNYQVNAGSPKQVGWLNPLACRVTEPPYYSTFACKGLSRLSARQHRHGYKGMATAPESPAAWEEGR
jgi:hypothetical protein